MFELNPTRAVYLHRDAIDFRKSINGLAALVEHELHRDVFANAVFVFANRRRDRIKMLGWDTNGFWLLHKRLQSERFVWPREEQGAIELSVQQLHWLLKGIDIRAMRGHRMVSCSSESHFDRHHSPIASLNTAMREGDPRSPSR